MLHSPLLANHTWENAQGFKKVSGTQVHAACEWDFNLRKGQVIRTQNFTSWEKCVSKEDRQTERQDDGSDRTG